MRAAAVVVIGVIAAMGCERATVTGSRPRSLDAAPRSFDEQTVTRVRVGMSLVEVERVLGFKGHPMQNASRFESRVNYDYDRVLLQITYQTVGDNWSAKSKEIHRDDKTVSERLRARARAWSEWVRHHQPEPSDGSDEATPSEGDASETE